MKTRLIFLVIMATTIIGCVPKSKYEKLRTELEETKTELSRLTSEYDSLLKEKRQAEIERNKKPYVTESQALGYLKDYYEFYNRDWIYRNQKVRRVDNNVFNISLEQCMKRGDFSNNDFYWSSSVLKLTVNKDGTYRFE